MSRAKLQGIILEMSSVDKDKDNKEPYIRSSSNNEIVSTLKETPKVTELCGHCMQHQYAT